MCCTFYLPLLVVDIDDDNSPRILFTFPTYKARNDNIIAFAGSRRVLYYIYNVIDHVLHYYICT